MLSVYDLHAPRDQLGELTIASINEGAAIARGSPCRVGLHVRPYGGKSAEAVVVQGVGATADEALKDALRKAVEQVAGTYMDSETLVENDRLALDRVASYSDGFVDHHEDVGNPRQEGGLVYRTIRATIRRTDLARKFEEERRRSAIVDASGLYGEAFTKFERRKNAADILTKKFVSLPSDVVAVELQGGPQIGKTEDQWATVLFSIKVYVDRDKYRAIQEQLETLLDNVADQKGAVECETITRLSGRDTAQRHEFLQSKFASPSYGDHGNLEVMQATFNGIQTIHAARTRVLMQGDGPRRGSYVVLMLDGGWKRFHLPDHIQLAEPTAHLVVTFRGRDGKSVAERSWAWRSAVPSLTRRLDTTEATYIVSRYFLACMPRNNNVVHVAHSLLIEAKATLSDQELKQTKTLDVRIVPGN